MTRRGFLAPALGAALAGCSPLALVSRLGPRGRGASRVAHDIAYGRRPRQRLDLWAPAGEGPWPTLVFFYGAHWPLGSKEFYGWAAQALAARGFVVAIADYRLVPEVGLPAFVEDAAAAAVRTAELAPRHGGDPRRLGVLGHSAGAYLALMVTLDRRYMGSAGAAELIGAAAGLSGPYDVLPFALPTSINAFGRAPDPTLTQPVAFARGDAAPVWLGHGANDAVVQPDDSTTLDAAIRAAGGRSQARLYPGLSHGDLIAAFSPLFRDRAPVLDEVTAFFQRELG